MLILLDIKEVRVKRGARPESMTGNTFHFYRLAPNQRATLIPPAGCIFSSLQEASKCEWSTIRALPISASSHSGAASAKSAEEGNSSENNRDLRVLGEQVQDWWES